MGTISTVAVCGAATASCVPGVLGDGGPAPVPWLVFPEDVVVDSTGNVYFSDGQRVRKVGGGTDAAAQDVPAIRARLGIVNALALDGRGNLYLIESDGHRVRKVDVAGIITMIAGDGTAGFRGDGGPATAARVNRPFGIAADSAGNVYIADTNNARVRRINPAGIITTIAGNGVRIPSVNNVPATSTSIIGPQGVDLDAAGNLYIADLGAHRIRKITYGPPAAAPPAIGANGVVNGASFQPGIVPNSWATVRGSGFSIGTATWDGAIVNGKLPTTLSGVTVTIGGQLAYPYLSLFCEPGADQSDRA